MKPKYIFKFLFKKNKKNKKKLKQEKQLLLTIKEEANLKENKLESIRPERNTWTIWHAPDD
mgnify:CR=1 FL=1